MKPNYAGGENEAFFLLQNQKMIPLYSVCILLGMILSIMTIAYFGKREKQNGDHLGILILITIPFSIIGARLGFVFERILAGEAADIKDNGGKPGVGGLSIQGGIILAASMDLLYIYFRRDVLDYRLCLSIILPSILIGQAIGRGGNFANHEVFGKVDPEGKHSNNNYITNYGC